MAAASEEDTASEAEGAEVINFGVMSENEENVMNSRPSSPAWSAAIIMFVHLQK